MVHPNELDQQIDNLRTLQESYDAITGAITFTNPEDARQSAIDIAEEIYQIEE